MGNSFSLRSLNSKTTKRFDVEIEFKDEKIEPKFFRNDRSEHENKAVLGHAFGKPEG